MRSGLHRFPSCATLPLAIAVLASECAPRGGGGPASDSAATDSPAARAPESVLRSAPEARVAVVVVTLRRSSLGVAEGAPLDSLRAAMLRGLAALQRSVAFDIVDVSPVLRAARLRPVRGTDTAQLAALLRRESSVEASEVEGVARKQP